MSKDIKSIRDLQPDPHNANKGTERGRYMVEASLRETGAGRSIVADREGRIIAGNKTLEAAADLGLDVEVVQTDGKRLVVVQRTDLDIDDPAGVARKLAYYDNRTGEVGLAWDAEQIQVSIDAGLDLDGLFLKSELTALMQSIDIDLAFQPGESDHKGLVDYVFSVPMAQRDELDAILAQAVEVYGDKNAAFVEVCRGWVGG